MVKEKFNLNLLISTILLAIISVFSFTTEVSADSLYGNFYYTLNSDYEVTITGAKEGVASLSIPTILNGYPVKYIGQYAFQNNTAIQSVVIPNTITTIPYKAFTGATNLTSVTLPSTIVEIDNYAFEYCTNLSKITLPSGLKEIGYASFKNTSLTSISIPNTVTSIDGYAFQNTDITSAIVPSSINVSYNLGDGIFADCTKLKTVTLNNNYVSYKMFDNASSLTTVKFVGAVTTISSYAFRNCISLKSLTLPKTVTTLNYNIFDGASSLTKVVIPSSVTTISDYAFESAPSTLTLYVERASEAERHAINNGLNYVVISNFDNVTVANIPNQSYTGKAITPNVVVKDGTKTLVKGTDYTVSYKNNVNVGTATVTITGINAYYGTVTKTFKIVESSSGLKYNTSTKRWEYYRNGKPDYTYNGYASNNNGTFYVENGIITFKFNKLVKYNGKWTAIVASKVQPKYTGISTNNTGSYYLKNGELTFKYNGTYKDSKGNVYILKNSKVDTSVTKLKSVGGTWYYFKKGKTDLNYTGVAKNSNGMYYVNKGKITFKHNELIKYNNKWYAVVNSKLVTNYSGLSTNKNGTYMLIKGELNFNYSGYHVGSDGNIYILKNSRVDSSFTGLKKVGGVWLYFKKGVNNDTYTGLVSNNNGTWYVQKGVLTFKYNGKITYKGKVYTVKNSKVIL